MKDIEAGQESNNKITQDMIWGDVDWVEDADGLKWGFKKGEDMKMPTEGEIIKDSNEFYTPDISDIRIGYECELYDDDDRDWTFIKVINQSDLLNVTGLDLQLRVAYLTKEAIEAEGWTSDEEGTENFFIYKNNYRYYLFWYPVQNRVEFGDEENEIGFAGECKSINEFRYICYLLNIK